MSKEKLTKQKEEIGDLRLIDRIVIGLILVVVYSVLINMLFHAKRPDLSSEKPKILVTK